MQTIQYKMTNSKPQDITRTLKFTTENSIVYKDLTSTGEDREQTNNSCLFFLVSLESSNLNRWTL